MIITQVPDYPWQKVASDLFSFDGESYVLVGDYFSKFVEYTKLSHDTKSASMLTVLQESLHDTVSPNSSSRMEVSSMTQKSSALLLPSMVKPI